jgi:MtN3 and saliva related transmembrane protein
MKSFCCSNGMSKEELNTLPSFLSISGCVRLLNPVFHSIAEEIILLYIEILGFLGGALTTLGYIPQLARILKLRSAREISIPFTLSLIVGAACWLTYGVVMGLTPVILWNSAGIILLLTLLYGKLKYGRL